MQCGSGVGFWQKVNGRCGRSEDSLMLVVDEMGLARDRAWLKHEDEVKVGMS